MAFKLGSESRKYRTPKETPILRKKLDKGILGEANNDGSIFVDKSLKPGSKKYNEVIKHEKQHIDDMDSGKLAYGNDWVRYNGKTYPRKGGKIKYGGKWKVEGHNDFPWEKRADKAIKSPVKNKEDGWEEIKEPYKPFDIGVKNPYPELEKTFEEMKRFELLLNLQEKTPKIKPKYKGKELRDILKSSSPTKQNGNITTKKEERKIKKGWSDSRKAKYKETEKGMKELGIDKIERKYRDLRYPYQDDKKIKMLKRDIADLKEKANNAGKVNKNRILNKIKKLKAKLPKRAQ